MWHIYFSALCIWKNVFIQVRLALLWYAVSFKGEWVDEQTKERLWVHADMEQKVLRLCFVGFSDYCLW